MAQTLFSYRAAGKTDMSALECFKHVLGVTQEAQTAAKEEVEVASTGSKDAAAAEAEGRSRAVNASVDALHAKSSADLENESPGTLACVALCPCYVCFHGFGRALSDGEKLDGLAGAVSYICQTKETNVFYKWTIQNYHYETRTYTVTVSDGNGGTRTETRTRQVRVNTHYAATSGMLACNDVSDMFVPNMRKRNCVISSELELQFTSSFGGEYERRRQMFYNANIRDTCQDKQQHTEIPGMKKSVRVEWAETGAEDPWWTEQWAMCLSTITCTAACWFVKMRNFMCESSFTFKKQAYEFLH